MISSQQLYNGFHDRIEKWLENSFRTSFLVDDKFLLENFLQKDMLNRVRFYFINLLIILFLIIIFGVHFLSRLNLMERLHWKFDFT